MRLIPALVLITGLGAAVLGWSQHRSAVRPSAFERAAAAARRADAHPFGTVVGSYPHASLTLVSLRRTGRNVVSARLSVALDRQAGERWLPELEGEQGDWYTAEGLRLVDETNARELAPLKDADGNCMCSVDIHQIDPGQRITVSALFPAPPPDVTRAALHTPGFPSFDDVPLGP
ncbi:MAG TPA: hypothetical protein VFT42_06220 [Solirubrobacteraceae bacterium]|nr:hypothetical protein [Solirubrobacteraceae bacterium]